MTASRTTRVFSACLAAVLALPVAPVHAAGADDLKDIVGAKGRDGEGQMERRGYTFIDAGKSNTASYTYWWNNSSKSCVRVTTRDGNYAEIINVDAGDCGQTRKESGMSDGAKVAVAAAALLGVAALAHKSHHRDDRNYDDRQTADFERGYRDGLYNNSYHNYDNRREYSDGYSKGIEERRHQSSYRDSYYDRGGYQSYVNVRDLANQDPSYAFREMERRGFSLVHNRRLGGGETQWLYLNRNTRQCVELVSGVSRVSYVGNASDGACRS